jgi:hypothetical protein
MLAMFLVLELFPPLSCGLAFSCGEIGFGSSIVGVETITVHLLSGLRAFQAWVDLELKPYFIPISLNSRTRESDTPSKRHESDLLTQNRFQAERGILRRKSSFQL